MEKPVMEMVTFEAKDVIQTSGGCIAKCPTDCIVVCDDCASANV